MRRPFSQSLLLCSVVSLVLSLLALPARAEPHAPSVGQRHADFTLPSIHDGKPVSLAQFRGKKVLLIQFAAW